MRLELECGAVAHGGHVVARVPADVPEVGGVVVFVRHAVPGERVGVVVTEGAVGDRFLRGDAVEVLVASPDRVEPPCPYAGPGGCGGCDFQHVSLDRQRALKAEVVAEQLRRIASIERDVEVVPLGDPDEGLRWRRRMRFHRLDDGRLGLRKHRSHEVVPIEDCRVQAPDAVVTVQGEEGSARTVVEHLGDHAFAVRSDGFWQAHRDAPAVYSRAVLDLAQLRPGDRVVDLYAGVGVLSAPLAAVVGQTGAVLAVEGDRAAAELAEGNLAAYPWVRVVRSDVEQLLAHEVDGGAHHDVVVLDPPRVGARREVLERVVALAPRCVVHVGCDPAAFARDAAVLQEHGYLLSDVRAYDAFPMTHHVELLGRFVCTVGTPLGTQVS
jgi:tRNA/tmRNA/rRNA uracil-C5-methylase (TrmA/RlmC/RlmD family)